METASLEVGNEPDLTMKYILAQMEKVCNEKSYVEDAVQNIAHITTEVLGLVELVTGATREILLEFAKTAEEDISDMVKSRETTLQKMLDVYGKLAEKAAGA